MKFKKIISISFAFLMTIPVWAQLDGEKNELDGFDWAIGNIVLLMASAVITASMFALYRATKTIWKAQTISAFESEGMSHAAAVKKVRQESFLAYIYQQLDGGVDLEHEEDVLLNHNYDGIRELDNNLPPWWVGMFYISIAFAFFFIGYNHFSAFGKSNAEEYELEVMEGKIIRAKYAEAQRLENEAKGDQFLATAKMLTDEEGLLAGKKVFDQACAVCHKKDGGGLTGPNMTDEYWIHGGSFPDLVKVIVEGVPGKNMISWKEVLKPEEIQQVASYILTLQGTDPDNAKEPEGEKYVAGSTPVAKGGEEEIN